MGLRISIVELLRQPTYIVTTMLFPSMFFWFFGVPNATAAESAKLLMGSFSAFAVMGVVLFQLAVQTAQERSLSWNRYLRTLPVSLLEVLIYKVAASLLLAVLAVGLVVATALSFTPLGVSMVPWGSFCGNLLLAGIPFLLLGLCLGYGVQGKSAVPVANLVYLPLSFAGGLWMPPNILPKAVQNISEYLPTRWYGEIVWDSLFIRSSPVKNYLELGVMSAVLMLVFFVLYRRDQNPGK
jgi:ABC-2 type transport system permease protein